VSAEREPTHLELLRLIGAGAAHQTSVAPGLGYPNHSDVLSPNPTGWLNQPTETRSVSRETTQSTSAELRGSN
jgi:hypothetical protein